MSDNGRIPIIGAPHRTVADLSSRDRSALMDETLMTVHELLLQVAGMGQAILALKREKDALEATVATLRSEASSLSAWQDARHDAIATDYLSFRTRSFLARLRWLLAGR